MPIEIEINEDDLSGFSEPARERLKQAAEDYVSTLISESNRIEAGRNSNNGPAEITQAMVNDAVVVQRQGLSTAPTRVASKVLRVVAAVLSLIVGFMYDPVALQSQAYMATFVVLTAAAIIAMTISILKE